MVQRDGAGRRTAYWLYIPAYCCTMASYYYRRVHTAGRDGKAGAKGRCGQAGGRRAYVRSQELLHHRGGLGTKGFFWDTAMHGTPIQAYIRSQEPPQYRGGSSAEGSRAGREETVHTVAGTPLNTQGVQARRAHGRDGTRQDGRKRTERVGRRWR